MTSNQIRQSFLDFFASKQHAIVPSASLMPDSPNLLFTNAGMNQFVPYFLGEREPSNRRITDTQKCIRAGGKHNDLEDVGLDTYHHTFFEMLGNWSIGDYFKQEAIEWAWELITKVWKFPKERLYASVYQPSAGDPGEFDQEAYDFWKAVFEKEGLDPEVHIVFGDKKDNYWMMGDTGPCGPCSELHVDLTPAGDTKGKLVNADSPYCIEIWNLVFIQYNATPDGEFVPLKAKHIDTGMGFERVAGIMATSKNFTDFSTPPSNYNSDLFDTLFQEFEKLSGHKYQRTLPEDLDNISEVEMKDVIFRVLADHIRCLSCSIADGILPGNESRNYVLRRILRRAVMYGRKLGLEQGFFAKLVPVVVNQLGHVFPELKQQEEIIQKIIKSEEDAFGRTLDRGLQYFYSMLQADLFKWIEEHELDGTKAYFKISSESAPTDSNNGLENLLRKYFEPETEQLRKSSPYFLSGEIAFTLYDTYGFPLDLTELMAKQKGISVDTEGFELEMEKQRAKGRAAHKSTDILVADSDAPAQATKFLGFDTLADEAELIDIVKSDDAAYLVFNHTPFYAEMGGQVGDTGEINFDDVHFDVLDTVKDPNGRFLHKVSGDLSAISVGDEANLIVAHDRRKSIERHHSATHVLHWALRKVLGTHVRQAGSYVDDQRLRFDFSHFEAVKPDELALVEKLCNEHILANSKVKWFETPFDQRPEGVMAEFGEKYGDVVRVVDIGGFSKELCGGTHVRGTGEIGLLKITSESGIAAGTRRIEAIAGDSLYSHINDIESTIATASKSLSAAPADLLKKLDTVLARNAELEKQLKSFQQKASGNLADDLLKSAQDSNGLKLVAAKVDADNPNALRQLGANLIGKLGEGVVILGAEVKGKVSIVAFSSGNAIAAGHKAGDIIRDLTAKLGGRGGGKPDFAMGGATDVDSLEKTLGSIKL
ncbi:alanine--tRNA ligase [Pelagicoccus sp. SDUM812002]|uniref:alanine--tRNA ligase n=1 Tax=Pelagicoccus sp. SDUM812002 TaxID=3041266 RepID=UPI00280FCD7D|nr:alanine--tRNA ligase [Pelagicoccus sp. SDUM812002]MDQ8183998.1 alanine--tRNA ligase [Pelagicoccus sp. SDUM812002]